MLIPRPSIRLGEMFPSVPVALNSSFFFFCHLTLFVIPFPTACVLKVGEIFWKAWIEAEFPFRAVAWGMYLKLGFFPTLLLCEAHCKGSLELLHPASFGHCWSSFPRVFGERMNSFIRTKFGPES